MDPSPSRPPAGPWGAGGDGGPMGTAEAVALVVEVHGVGAIHTRVCRSPASTALTMSSGRVLALSWFLHLSALHRVSDSLNALREVPLP